MRGWGHVTSPKCTCGMYMVYKIKFVFSTRSMSQLKRMIDLGYMKITLKTKSFVFNLISPFQCILCTTPTETTNKSIYATIG